MQTWVYIIKIIVMVIYSMFVEDLYRNQDLYDHVDTFHEISVDYGGWKELLSWSIYYYPYTLHVTTS
jgi:hypothetical protein